MRPGDKLRILFALLDLEAATFADLAREARTAQGRIEGAVFGDGEAYRVRTALLRLRLVRVKPGVVGDVVVLTPTGSKVAKAWRSESARATIGLRRHAYG